MAGNYVNPGWVNGGSPALDATNLNNLSNAVVQNQTDIATLNDDLDVLAGKSVTVETESFTDAQKQTARTNIGAYGSTDDTNLFKKFANLLYPVGCYYWSSSNTHPSTLFGGTWEVVSNKFLFASGGNYTVGSTGGEEKHTLSVAELASHTHSFTGTAGNTGNNIKEHDHKYDKGTNPGTWSIKNGDGDYIVVSKPVYFNSTYTEKTVISHAHTFTPSGTNSNTGSNTAHNNMPPYVVAYCWHRTA